MITWLSLIMRYKATALYLAKTSSYQTPLSLVDHSHALYLGLTTGLCIQSQKLIGCGGNSEAEDQLIMLIQETDKDINFKNLKPLESHTHTKAVWFRETGSVRNNETFVRVGKEV